MFTTKFKAIACLSFFVLVLMAPLVLAQSVGTSGGIFGNFEDNAACH